MEPDESVDDEKRRFEAQYEIMEVAPVGEGTYGKVYKARDKKTGKIVAMKKMKPDSDEEGVAVTAMRELLVQEVLHENVVELLDVFCSTVRMVLVYEFVESDLKKYMKSVKNSLTSAVIKRLSRQLCSGVEACHMNGILHRDLKPQNLLIDSQLNLKIADFGLARAYSVPIPKYTHEVVTLNYRAPEILLGSPLYSLPVDMWSVGCILAEMATGAPLFPGKSEIGTIFGIFQKLGTPSLATWPDIPELKEWKPNFPKFRPKRWEDIRNTKAQVGELGIDLLQGLLAYAPQKRLSARTGLMHAYFATDASCVCRPAKRSRFSR